MTLLEIHPDAPLAAPSVTVMATVLFTDIVGSTARAAELGDSGWTALVGEHDRLTREELDSFGGQEIKTLGDGFLAAFDTPSAAVLCAERIVQRAAKLGVRIRAGIHAGECESVGGDLMGLAVHISSRITSLAGPFEVLVSGTVRELLLGSSLEFQQHGLYALKGVPGTWPVHVACGRLPIASAASELERLAG